jgi:hypothetical protein
MHTMNNESDKESWLVGGIQNRDNKPILNVLYLFKIYLDMFINLFQIIKDL